MSRRAILLGALAPLSRPGWEDAGRHLLAGLALAVAEVNAAGGVQGQALELVVRDTRANPREATVAVDELAAIGVTALVGEYHSVVAQAVATRADALELPFLCSSAVLDALVGQPSGWIARLAPEQSRGWQAYADFLFDAGHRHVAVVAESSAYWAAGTRILRDCLVSRDCAITELDAASLASIEGRGLLVRGHASALLLLMGYPGPIVSAVESIRGDRRLADLWIGAPAGQPEFPGWGTALGAAGAGIPFLRYLPPTPTPLGARVEAILRRQLAGTPSFVALEGYDTIIALAEALGLSGGDRSRMPESWPRVSTEGTRGLIRFSRVAGSNVWQWPDGPIQIADRDPGNPDQFRVLKVAPPTSGPRPS